MKNCEVLLVWYEDSYLEYCLFDGIWCYGHRFYYPSDWEEYARSAPEGEVLFIGGPYDSLPVHPDA